MRVITLLTDFGTKDGFVGTMKGVIWRICPDARIADISHEISPQNVVEAALILRRAAPFFPDDTVHVAVVDPGVGTGRRAMAARIGKHFFVGPDNGLFTPLIEEARSGGGEARFVALDQPRFWLPAVSRTFHGRDVFAPVGAHLARGERLEALGTPFADPVMLALPHALRTADGFTAHVTAVDGFGNIATDLTETDAGGVRLSIAIKGRVIDGVCESYGSRPPGELVALWDSGGGLEVAVVNGSAAGLLGVRAGDEVRVRFTPGPRTCSSPKS